MIYPPTRVLSFSSFGMPSMCKALISTISCFLKLLFQAVCSSTKIADMGFQRFNIMDVVVKQILAQFAVLFQIVDLCPLGVGTGIALIEIHLQQCD